MADFAHPVSHLVYPILLLVPTYFDSEEKALPLIGSGCSVHKPL
jgi:hypothetical protein